MSCEVWAKCVQRLLPHLGQFMIWWVLDSAMKTFGDMWQLVFATAIKIKMVFFFYTMSVAHKRIDGLGENSPANFKIFWPVTLLTYATYACLMVRDYTYQIMKYCFRCLYNEFALRRIVNILYLESWIYNLCAHKNDMLRVTYLHI